MNAKRAPVKATPAKKPAAKPAAKSSPVRKGQPQGVKATGNVMELPARKVAVPARPMPPEGLDEHSGSFAPAPEVLRWIEQQLLDEDGALFNPEHAHLKHADFAVLWASGGFKRAGRTVIGQAEQLAFRCGAWARERQELQMTQWFGRVPDYLITLDASYCRTCSDVDWCALVEHEMFHIGQQEGEFGPEWTKDGRPKLFIRGHDVEEFVSVVRRYGVGNQDGAVARLVRAGSSAPEVSRSAIAGSCGTCLLRAA